MKVPCSYPNCGDRRVHWEQPDTPRGQQYLDVPDDHRGPAYCSITCALLNGAYKKVDGHEKPAI